ncbi:MAG: 2-C-methyl-D-erythritol 4-phosphate cytidylyltransferase [Candidatus Eremiobacteraeota bacterium]|nr:2-C-methyl-D-erythritol 4-phosphate cytidylyltransferase [Candidatus Eremiobacteraeota bacterium]
MLWGAVIVAAGHGSRFGRPKQLVELAGAPLVAWSIRTFAHMPEIVDIVLVTESENIEAVYAIAAAVVSDKPFAVVAGGNSRQASVRAGVDALPARCNAVLVHDGARPLVRANDVRNAMRVVREGTASLLAMPVVDTIKVVESGKTQVKRTLNRQELWAAQTPQCATVHDMRRAHLEALRGETQASDDAALLERIGLDVVVVPGTAENFKVTVPEDLTRAEHLLRERAPITADQEEILLTEVFIDESLIEAVCNEIETRGGTIDGIDRDLPSGVAIRAYIASHKLAGFGERFETMASGQAMFTTHFSHFAPRSSHESLAGAQTNRP